jgi:hypothetical protein
MRKAKNTTKMPINYKDYPPDWKERSLFVRNVVACNCCKFCGIENYSINEKGSKVVLTVAHLNENKFDVSLRNLKALCQKCHLQYDMPKHIANRKKTLYDRKHKNQQTLF